MSRRVALAVLPFALLACAAPGRRLQRPARPASLPETRTATARAPFGPNDGAAIFARAVDVAAREGFPVKTCDARGARLETTPFELLDVACGATTCLARQTVEVKLGYHVARVVVNRHVYDGAVRAWLPDPQGSAVAARALVDRIVSAPVHDASADPCAAAARAELAALGTDEAGGR